MMDSQEKDLEKGTVEEQNANQAAATEPASEQNAATEQAEKAAEENDGKEHPEAGNRSSKR